MPLVRNLTPFELIMSAERSEAPVYEAGAFATIDVSERRSTPPLRRRRDGGTPPMEPADVPMDRLYVQRRGGDLEYPIGMVWITEPEKALSITVDQLRSSSDPTRGFARTRTFENCTSGWVDISIGGGDASTLATLGPGDRYVNDTPHAQLWVVRSAFSNEVVGAFIDDDDQAHREISYQITDDYRERLAEHAPLPSPLPGGRPLVLIGSKREIRPPEDRIYITTEDRDGPVRPEFNGRTDVVPRRVRVAGAKLIWDANNDHYGLMSLQGKDVLDLESLEMVADEVVIRSNLRFPGTNVSITARRVEFAERGIVDTSPPIVAEPKFTGPKKIPPETYTAKEGKPGPPGGSVTLIAGTLIPGDPGKIRICTRGGQGGKGEAGGLLAYTRRTTHAPHTEAPKESADCATVLRDDIASNLRAWFKTTAGNLDGWQWPGREEDPYHCRHEGAPLFWIGGSDVTSLLITAHDDGIIPETDWWEFPGGKRAHLLGRSDTKRYTEHRDPSESRRVPGDGADAYPGGRPGDGGAGGVVSTTVELAALVAQISDTRGGDAGPTTAAVEGAPPGKPEVAWLVDMAIVRRGGGRAPQMWVQKYSAQPGKRGDAQTANPGRDGGIQSGGASWLRVEAVDAVLAFAKAAFRDGHREEARRAIEPYYARFRSPIQQRRNPQFSSQIIALSTMRDNLMANLDYYGNPPGWLPRLSVSTNLALFDAVRQASYELLYFASTTERKFDDISHRRTLAGEVRTALERETTACHSAIKEATNIMAEARLKLYDIGNKLGRQQQDLDKLKNYAELEALSTAEKQRILKGVMQVVGGALQALPVGQPYLGAGGDLVSAVGEVDFFTSNKPADTAKEVLAKVGEATDSFLEDNADLLSAALTKRLRHEVKLKKKDVQKLSEQVTQANGEASQIEANAAEYTNPIADKRLEYMTTRRDELTVSRQQVEAAIQEFQSGESPDDVEKDEKIKKVARPKAEKEASLEHDLASLTKKIAELNAEMAELKEEDKKKNAERLVRLSIEQKALTEAKVRAETLQKMQADAEAKIEEAEEKSEAKQEKYAAAMGRLTSMGTGIGGIGAGIATLATPVSKDDTVVQDLAADLLKTKDPQQYQRVIREMKELGTQQNAAMAQLLKAQAIINSNVARMAESLTAQNNLGRQLHSMDNALDVRAKQYLKGMRQRAEEMLHSSMYHLAMSYRYEFLEDLPDSFVNYDRIVAALLQVDRAAPAEKPERSTAKPKPIGKPRRTVQEEDEDEDEDEPADLMEAVQEHSIDTTNPEEKFEEIDELVLKYEFLKLGVEIANQRQRQAGKKTTTMTVALREDQLQQLCRLGTITFNLVKDFGVVRYTWADARIAKLVLTELSLKSPDRIVNMRVDFKHSGESIINIPTSMRAPVYYYFRAAPTDDPVSWGFGTITKTVKSSRNDDGGDAEIRDATIVPDKDEELIEEFLAEALQSKNIKFQEYWPSLFSDITLTVDPGEQARLDAITDLVFDVTYAKRQTESDN